LENGLAPSPFCFKFDEKSEFYDEFLKELVLRPPPDDSEFSTILLYFSLKLAIK
jgi:hypothetical protein